MNNLTILIILFTICGKTMSDINSEVQELPSTGESEAIKHPTYEDRDDSGYHGNRSKKSLIGEFFGYDNSCLSSNSSFNLIFIAIIGIFSLM